MDRFAIKAQLLQELLELMQSGLAQELKTRHAPAAEPAGDPGALDAPGVEIPGVDVPMDSAAADSDAAEPDLGSLTDTELSALLGPDASSDATPAAE